MRFHEGFFLFSLRNKQGLYMGRIIETDVFLNLTPPKRLSSYKVIADFVKTAGSSLDY